MLTITRKLFDTWNDSNVSYCHWKSNEHLLDGLDGKTDVDVLVSSKDKEKCEDLLYSVGYRKFNPQVGARYSNVDEWIGFDYETGNLIHIHLHYEIITGKKFIKEYILPWADIALNTRIKEKSTGVYIISPNLEIIILFSRIVLKATNNKKNISKDYIREIKYLKKQIDMQQVKALCLQLFRIFGETIYNCIKKENITKEDLDGLNSMIRKELRHYRKVNSFKAFFAHKYHRYLRISKFVLNKKLSTNFILKKGLKQNGFSVCVIGADGAGKSTITEDIVKWLTWKIESRKFYLGSGDHYNSIFKKSIRLINRNRMNSAKEKTPMRSPSSKVVNNKNKEDFVKKTIRKVFYIMNSLELVNIARKKTRILKKSERYQKKGGIAIYDRFPQIQFEGIYDGPKIEYKYKGYLNNRLIKALAKKEKEILNNAIIYNPTIVLKLILPPELSIERKPDHDFTEIKTKAEITNKLVFKNSRVSEIDASQAYETELLEVKRIIWGKIEELL